MNYLERMKDTKPPADPEAIRSAETLIGSSFPEDYREYLCQSNGGTFEDSGVFLGPDQGETVLNYMNAADPETGYSIEKHYQRFRMMDRIPVLCVPIADDPGGNRFLLSLEKDSYGAVYFWDHDFEPEDGGDEIADFPNMTKVADSFESFIVSLKAE